MVTLLNNWIYGVFPAFVKLTYVLAILAVVRVLFWVLNVFVVLPVFDP